MILERKTKPQKNNEGTKEYAEEFVEIVQKAAGDKKLLQSFLQDILSPVEYKELGVRWQIIKQLSQGKSHRDVAKNLHTGVATVTRGSRALGDSKGGFRQILRLSAKKK